MHHEGIPPRLRSARARKHAAVGAPRIDVNTAEHKTAVAAFSSASAGGDLAALVALLDPDVTLTSDGGGAVSTARRPQDLGEQRVGVAELVAVERPLRPPDHDRVEVPVRVGEGGEQWAGLWPAATATTWAPPGPAGPPAGPFRHPSCPASVTPPCPTSASRDTPNTPRGSPRRRKNAS